MDDIQKGLKETDRLQATLQAMKDEGKISVALLFGSFANGSQHARSDIDIAIYLNAADQGEEMDLIDRILMSAERDVSILRLDDEDESPFIVQEALKGIHLVAPDEEAFYAVCRRALHESESIRFRRETNFG